MLRCVEEESLNKDKIHCPTCERYYSIWAIKHICNVLAPCSIIPKPVYEERYLNAVADSDDSEKILSIICEKCEHEHINKFTARKCQCPKCDFVGWYVHDETMICPACKEAPTKKKKVPTCMLADATDSTVDSITLQPATAYVEFSTPDNGVMTQTDHIEIRIRVLPDADLLQPAWFLENTFTCGGSAVAAIMERLAEYVKKLQTKYTLKWQFDKMLGRERMQCIYHNFGPKDFKIKF
jgi:hypothetical protein